MVASTARELLNKSENERSGVLSTAMSFLGLYRDPVVAKVTRRCDWRIADLIADAQPDDALPRGAALRHLADQATDPSGAEPDRSALDRGLARQRPPAPCPDDARRVPGAGRLDFFSPRSPSWRATASRAFLIAQSLNQIEKAYGPNNAILDNCHVRVSFATNDERTAKRVSDALGTATEMRAMKNYAGHRLNPWLGHLMVSRQETARPLLTPGEVMQLPPETRSSWWRARRRSERRRCATTRIGGLPSGSCRRPILRPSGRSSRTMDGRRLERSCRRRVQPTERSKQREDTANSGLRREPELPDHVAIVKETTEPTPAEEFAAVLDDDEDAVRQSRLLRQQMRGVARQVAMDPNDGMEL